MRATSPVILLVQHSSRDGLRLQYAFARAGHLAPIECSGDGLDAVAQLAGTGGYADRRLFPTPGLVVMDLDLERGSGFQVLSWIQASEDLAGLPSIVLTASRRPLDVQRAYALGAHRYRVRPASMEDLCGVAREIDLYWREVVRPGV